MMKRLLLTIALATATAAFAAAQAQKDQTLTGLITDSMCAQSHDANIEHAKESSGRTMTTKECTVGCVARRGQKYVLVSQNKVYQIANQSFAALATYAAENVQMTGQLSGDTITVSRVVPVERSK